MVTHDDEAALAEAERRVAAALSSAGFAAAAVTTDRAPGPAGTTRVRGVAAGAYPGSGVSVALVRGGAVYGPRAGLAELARALGWLSSPPEPQVAAQVANDLLWDGLAGFDDAEPAQVGREGDGALRIDVVRRLFPSGARDAQRVIVPGMGEARVGPAPAVPEPGPPTPIDRAAALLIALDGGRLAETMAAMRAITPPMTARERTALARATASQNDQLQADGLMKLGPSDEAAEALRGALAGVGGQVAASVRAMAAELWGPAFAAKLG